MEDSKEMTISERQGRARSGRERTGVVSKGLERSLGRGTEWSGEHRLGVDRQGTARLIWRGDVMVGRGMEESRLGKARKGKWEKICGYSPMKNH